MQKSSICNSAHKQKDSATQIYSKTLTFAPAAEGSNKDRPAGRRRPGGRCNQLNPSSNSHRVNPHDEHNHSSSQNVQKLGQLNELANLIIIGDLISIFWGKRRDGENLGEKSRVTRYDSTGVGGWNRAIQEAPRGRLRQLLALETRQVVVWVAAYMRENT